MYFLDAHPDLTDTIFTEADLRLARDYLTQLIATEDPAWLGHPVGFLARDWLSDELPAICRLIDLARTLNQLELFGLGVESKPVFFQKIRHLLRKIQKGPAFEEALTELQVASRLSERVGQVLLEPRILELAPGAKPHFLPLQRSKLLDLAFFVESQILFVETTVLRIESLDKWAKSVQALAQLINNTLWLEGLNYQVDITLPFPLPPELSSVYKYGRFVNLLFDQLVTRPAGETAINLTSDAAQAVMVYWQAAGPAIAPAEITLALDKVSCSVRAEDYAGLLEAVFKSLRNSLQVKRQQFQLNTPFVLVLKIGNPLLPASLLHDLVERRLWPNSRFKWLSALAIFEPRAGYSLTDAEAAFLTSVNPNARFAASPALLSAFG